MTENRIPPYAPMTSDEAADLAFGVIQKGGDDIAALALMLHAIHLDLQRLAPEADTEPVSMPGNVTVYDIDTDTYSTLKSEGVSMNRGANA